MHLGLSGMLCTRLKRLYIHPQGNVYYWDHIRKRKWQTAHGVCSTFLVVGTSIVLGCTNYAIGWGCWCCSCIVLKRLFNSFISCKVSQFVEDLGCPCLAWFSYVFNSSTFSCTSIEAPDSASHSLAHGIIMDSLQISYACKWGGQELTSTILC